MTTAFSKIGASGDYGGSYFLSKLVGPAKAKELYFTDPDGHLLEYLAMLPQEPRPAAGVVPYSQWQRMPPTI